MFSQLPIYLFGHILTSQTGGQPYSDTSPYEVLSDCSLVKLAMHKKCENVSSISITYLQPTPFWTKFLAVGRAVAGLRFR